MSDSDLRNLERQAAGGDRDAAADLYFMRARIGVKKNVVTYPLKPPFEVKVSIIKHDHYETLSVSVNDEDPRWPEFSFNADWIDEEHRDWLCDVMASRVEALLNKSYETFVSTHLAAFRAVMGL